jgi:hypothetical protein
LIVTVVESVAVIAADPARAGVVSIVADPFSGAVSVTSGGVVSTAFPLL